ncbi:hypothetical protein [Ktedonobacter sp. SOSP1-52]|uniref:hypothetical protein n=1 Tax=Ktedonobacter sp. SOSP1-52 TaxID=2778366 RepID=UPI001F1B240A|nr:hypothetical protein [Ktedonobacter sp. SOSP1-52]
MALHPLHGVPLVLLEQVQLLFGSQDRRCLNGQEFLAQWLRGAHVEQIPLLPHEPALPVAVLTVQNLRAFCTSPLSAWPWCYDTTTKYLSVLQAAGLLLKVKQPKGMGATYYFPLTATPCLPVCTDQVQRLAGRRKSVRRSRALQRVSGCMEVSGPEDTYDGKEAGDVKSRPVHLRLVPSSPQGQDEQGTHDSSSQMMQRHGEPSGKEDPVGRTVERLAAVMQSSGTRVTPAVKASMAAIVWEECIRPAQSVSPQLSDQRALVSSSPGTQMHAPNDGPLNGRRLTIRKSRWSRSRSRGVDEGRRPQGEPSTPEEQRRLHPDASTRMESGEDGEKTSTLTEDRRPVVSTSVLEEDHRPQPKPSTSVEDRRPLVQEKVDVRGAQTQTNEAHTHTHVRARVEFNTLNTHQLPKKEIHEKNENELREQGYAKKKGRWFCECRRGSRSIPGCLSSQRG